MNASRVLYVITACSTFRLIEEVDREGFACLELELNGMESHCTKVGRCSTRRKEEALVW